MKFPQPKICLEHLMPATSAVNIVFSWRWPLPQTARATQCRLGCVASAKHAASWPIFPLAASSSGSSLSFCLHRFQHNALPPEDKFIRLFIVCTAFNTMLLPLRTSSSGSSLSVCLHCFQHTALEDLFWALQFHHISSDAVLLLLVIIVLLLHSTRKH